MIIISYAYFNKETNWFLRFFTLFFCSEVNPCSKDANYQKDVCTKIASKHYGINGKLKFTPGYPQCVGVYVVLTQGSHDQIQASDTIVECGVVGHKIMFGRGVNLHGACLFDCDDDLLCHQGDEVENVMY